MGRGCKLSETYSAKIVCQEGNSLEYLIRSQSKLLVQKEVSYRKSSEGRLGGSHSLKKA